MDNTLSNIKYEKALWDKGVKIVAGVDEVGRGCLAGPLVACAVVWPPEIATWNINSTDLYKTLLLITDSKKITLKRREVLSDFIIKNCVQYALVEISSEEIDQHGVGEANKKALETAALSIKGVEHVLVDHYKIFEGKAYARNSGQEPVIRLRRMKLDCNECEHTLPSSTSITKGDLLSISIASASIVAKVYRDKIMREKFHPIYPQYGFDKHVGYGTKKHLDAIKKHGQTLIHRKSFNTKH